MKKIENIFKLKDWESKHLPLCKSSIGQALFRYVAQSHLQGHTPSLKELINDLPDYSRAGIQIQLKKLEAEGWINLTNGISDGRNRHISSTDQLNTLLKQYRKQIQRLLHD